MRERIRDPTAEETFRSAKLDWRDLSRAPHAQWLDWYRRTCGPAHRNRAKALEAAGHAGVYRNLRSRRIPSELEPR